MREARDMATDREDVQRSRGRLTIGCGVALVVLIVSALLFWLLSGDLEGDGGADELQAFDEPALVE